LLACAAYLSVALPSSTLGLLWPSMRLSFGEPIGALGILLVFGITASVISSVATGRVSVRTGPLVAAGTMLTAVALALESFAPSLWVMAVGMVLFGLGFGAIDAVLNAHAARHFGARDINWMHASYGLGATIGPLLVTVLLAEGLGWRRTYGLMALVQAALACVFIARRRGWRESPRVTVSPADGDKPGLAGGTARRKLSAAAALTFAAVETGLESGAGIWGYVFLTAGRGLPHGTAGVAVSAYWAMMFAGRLVLGPVAQRLGPAGVLPAAVVGIPAGAALMTVPGPGSLAVVGLMILGLAAAPVFPLLTLMTLQWAGPRTTRMVGLQVAASAVGSAALPAGLGLAIGAVGARILAPSLFVLGLAMGGLYALLWRWSGRGARQITS
jgi:fucose permease